MLWLTCACERANSAVFDDPPPDASSGTSSGGQGGGNASSAGGSAPSAVAGSPPGGAPAAAGKGGIQAQGEGGGGRSPGADQVAGQGGADADSDELADGGGGPESPLEARDPVCGNGLIEPGEECDDSGLTGSDACMGCQVVCSLFGAGAVESKDHHCYRSYEEASFEGARAACEALGGYLATIADKEENELVRTLVTSSNFIGGFEDVALMSGATGAYGWVSREPFVFTNWAAGEPNRDDGYCSNGAFACFEHCLAMIRAGTWEDHRCDLADGYVCEWEPPGRAP